MTKPIRSKFCARSDPHPLRFDGLKNCPKIERISEKELRISWPKFRLSVGVNCEAHVLSESEELARKFAPLAFRERIARCASRIEVSGTLDRDMDHFNDYCFVVEAVERLGNVFVFSQDSGEFMNI